MEELFKYQCIKIKMEKPLLRFFKRQCGRNQSIYKNRELRTRDARWDRSIRILIRNYGRII